MTIFFTSDLHFTHNNIIKYCDRPFANTKEMDETIIHNWNETVEPNDIVYFLGDFSFSKESKNLFVRLNGNKHIIMGNHDNSYTKSFGWSGHYLLKQIKVADQEITLCHYAMRVWDNSFRGAWMLYGHSHGTLLEDETMSCDVGVDVWGYRPVSYERLLNKMLWKKANKQYFLDIKAKYTENEAMDTDVRKKILGEIRQLNSKF